MQRFGAPVHHRTASVRRAVNNLGSADYRDPDKVQEGSCRRPLIGRHGAPVTVEEDHVLHPVVSRRVRRGALALGATVALLASLPLSAGAAPGGFLTSQAAMLAPGAGAPAGTQIKALLTVGDQVTPAYTYLSIPDGISVKPAGKGGAQLFVNHETSTSPFPYGSLGPPLAPPTTTNSFNDFDNSQLSKLVLRKSPTGDYGIMGASIVIPSSANYQRFCSNFIALTDGFENRPMVFTNEETPDWYRESGTAWDNASSLETAAGAREGGVTVAYDVNGGTYKTLLGMGRFNHENTVAIPGYGHPFLMSGDDTFTSQFAQSQVYAYSAASADAVWNQTGKLMAFVPDDAYSTINDYYDFPIDANPLDAGSLSISGHFIEVPEVIATGKLPSGAEITADTVPAELGGPYAEPPNGGVAWQARPFDWDGTPTNLVGIDGPQWVLERWSDLHNVFQFTRIEDMAYDKRWSNVVYLADSGRGAATNGGNAFVSSNGRIWKMVLDPNDPTIVTSLSLLIEGDDNPVKTLNEVHQPDNLETTVNGLYILEDPGSRQQFASGDQGLPNATTARAWQYKFDNANTTDGTLAAVLKVDQSADEGSTDVDQAGTAGLWGEWESTGMVDVSAIFGPGTFLINVQAHTLFTEIDTTSAPDNVPVDGVPDWTWKREGGQLLLVTIPGG
jgi:hypothetical protein